MSWNKTSIGKQGEKIASIRAEASGYEIVARNIRTPAGEIDLILRKDGALVFAEVKTRTSRQYGYPENAVNSEKLDHMIHAAEHYLADLEGSVEWRLDVISVELDPNKKSPPKIHWLENVSAYL